MTSSKPLNFSYKLQNGLKGAGNLPSVPYSLAKNVGGDTHSKLDNFSPSESYTVQRRKRFYNGGKPILSQEEENLVKQFVKDSI